MKRSIGLWQLMGFAVTSLGGTLLHFLYDWLGNAVWAAPFSSVNESTFEHMKLLFFPMLIFAVVQSFFFRDRKDFWCVKLLGILLGLSLIPINFYTCRVNTFFCRLSQFRPHAIPGDQCYLIRHSCSFNCKLLAK